MTNLPNEFDYINRSYGLNVRKGGRVEYTGAGEPKAGTIVAADGPYLSIKLDGDKHPSPYHPTWELKVL